jgi:hypothetical protein
MGMLFRVFAPKPLKKARRITHPTIVATLALFFALGGAASTAQPVARAACSQDVSATIEGEHKCLGPGEYCKLRAERQYERYGFVCSTRYNPPRLRRR